ncbi:MAG: D-glycero-beta-D-manno-heptose 1,7-bisphosphate 7-phosphatase [Pseudomonadota bacterium]|nr:D-glycero-beta-D-manno-heptose 1,7-bisphosphate 7-phosphatase [Pseudomonadota bacterium]
MLLPIGPTASPAPPARGWIVLDRDGVINRDRADYVKTPQELDFLPGSLAAIARLTEAGFGMAVATNQSAVGRGLLTREGLAVIHAHLESEIQRAGGRLAGIFVCPHAPDADCRCRKPRPGLLQRIAAWASIDPAALTVVGDAARDLEAARSIGARAVLVRTGHGERTLQECGPSVDFPVFMDLDAFAARWVATTSDPAGEQQP